MQAWANGRLLPSADAPAVPVTDRGFMLGAGAFETLKVVDGQPFALTRHLARLSDGASRLGLTAPDDELVRRGVAEVIAAQPLARGRLRITWTGETLSVLAGAATAHSPVTGVVTSPYVRNERSPLAGMKCTSFAENTLSTRHAQDRGVGEALLANLAGDLCEGAGSNVFYVLDGELCTPSPSSGCLPGVTRGLVLEWYGAREVDAPVSVLERASEVFLTSSTRDVQAVSSVDGRGYAAPGPVTADVARVWAERAAEGIDP